MGCMNSVSSQQGDLLVSLSLSALNLGVGGGGGEFKLNVIKLDAICTTGTRGIYR